MGDEDEVMRFEITDQDLDDEFNYDNRRPRQSKNRAIYGIWAENSDDESGDEEMTKSRAGKKKSNYTTPIGFVSAGVFKGSKEEKNKDEDPDEIKSESETDEDEDLEPRASFAKGKKTKFQYQGGETAGLRTQNYQHNISLGKGFGEWEKHTKGIGAKLLLKMGYQAGKGLGKDLQGRSTIVEAHLRKGKGAIGAYGKEGNRPKVADGEGGKSGTHPQQQWRKGAKPSKVKYVYKSIEEVLDEGKWRKIRINGDEIRQQQQSQQTKVIDMTGKESRILSGYHAIGSAKHVPDDEVEVDTELAKLPGATHFDLPELTHNLNMIVDMCEESIISADRQLRHHKDRVEILTTEEEKLAALVQKEKDEIHSLEEVLKAIDNLEAKHTDGSLTVSDSLRLFTELKSNFKEAYVRYELPYIATTIVTPVMKKALDKWNPLSKPAEMCEAFHGWKNVLSLNPNANSPEGDPYYNFLWESWMPCVRRAATIWQIRIAPEVFINFLTAWSPTLIPKWMETNILLQLILPKLQKEVDLWNPLTDTVPIHSWLHPWLPLLGQNLEIVYPTIRNKLGNALVNWDPSDRSAKLILLPWKDIFSKGSMHTFLIKYIVPKLEMCMQKMVINPHQQHLNEWNNVMEWTDLIPTSVLVSLLEKLFFPKWLQVLATWINHNPNYDEVSKWYEGWKSVIPGEILANQQIKYHMNMALDMMNRAVGGGVQIPKMERFIPTTPAPTPTINNFKTVSEVSRISAQIPQGFKDLVAKRCEERGILFAPLMPARYREGKQIYRCGNLTLYLDRNVIFVQQPLKDVWVPTSLNTLIDTAFAS